MSDYKKEIDNMQWSYSRVNSFEHCKYEFYLNYIVDDDSEYLSENNFYAEVGSYVHEILAMIFDGTIKPEEAADYYIEHFDDSVFYKTRQSIMDKTFENCADYFCEADFSWLNNYEILGVELECKFKIKEYNFIGYIDLLLRDKRDNRIVIVDNKSSAYPFRVDGKVKAKEKDSFEKYKKQMYLYSYAVKEKYGELPKEIAWNHFKDGGRFAVIPFEKEEFDESIKWFTDSIKAIRNEKEFPSILEELEDPKEQNKEYFYCTNLCNFRNSCEYCKSLEWN